MITQCRFREDNTEGYSRNALRELNRRFDDALTRLVDAEEAPEDVLALESRLDALAEAVLVQFDAERTSKTR